MTADCDGTHPSPYKARSGSGIILRGVFNAGDIKDGAEVIAFVFNASNPGMKFVKAKTDLMISLWHGKKDPSDHLWHERNECHTVLTLLASEARTVVNAVVAAVR